MHKDKFIRLGLVLTILLVTLACSVSFDGGDDDDETEALKMQLTQQSMLITQTAMSAAHNKPAPATDSGGQPSTGDNITSPNSSVDDGVYAIKFLSETIPDGTFYWPGESFTKTWTIRNAGDFEWTKDFTLDFVNGSRMSGASSTKLGRTVNPGETITLSVALTAPDDPGDYTARWQVSTEKGVEIGWISVKITVGAPQAGPGFLTVDASFPFANTAVNLACPGTVNVTANITTNTAATLSCTWINSSQANGGQVTQLVTFAGAETQTISYVVGPIGYSDTYEVHLFIEDFDNPKQEYGPMYLHVNCY
jgi:hypothetical protein